MKVNYKISFIKPTEYLEEWTKFMGGFGVFLDTGILIDGALNNYRFRAYRKIFDDLFIKTDNIVLETSVVNIIEAMKILLNKATIHFIVDEFTHHEHELKNVLEKFQNFINKYYEDIRDSFGKFYMKKLKQFLERYKIQVEDTITITYEIEDEDLPEINYLMLEDHKLLNLFLLYDKKIEYNDFISIATASQLEEDIFITTDSRLADSIRDPRIDSIHIFPYVYSVLDREHVEELLRELMSRGLIEDYKIEKV